MRNRNRRSRGSDEINLTPLLDVLFTILFIVMLTGMQNERSMEESAQESEAQISGLESRGDELEEENDILKSEVSRRDKIQDSNKRYESNAVIVTLINETEEGEHVLKVFKGQEEPMETFRLGTDRTEYTRKHLTQIINEIVDKAGGYPVFIVFHCDAKQIYRKEEFIPIRDALETQKKLRKEVFYQIVEE